MGVTGVQGRIPFGEHAGGSDPRGGVGVVGLHPNYIIVEN